MFEHRVLACSLEIADSKDNNNNAVMILKTGKVFVCAICAKLLCEKWTKLGGLDGMRNED